MRRATSRQKPRTSRMVSFPAPTGGWVSNQNLAQPGAPINGAKPPQGAAILENFFPTATSVVLRRGTRRWATLGGGLSPASALFTYNVGVQQQLFGANETTIYDITTVSSPYDFELGTDAGDLLITDAGDTLGQRSTDNLDVMTGFTGGDWVVVQFATTGGTFLVGVNGMDDGFIYDGANFFPNVAGGLWSIDLTAVATPFIVGETITGATSSATAKVVKVVSNTLWIKSIAGGPFVAGETLTGSVAGNAKAVAAQSSLAPGIDFPAGSTLTTANLSYVWVYKNRLFFVQKNTLDCWYLPVDQIGGDLTLFPLGGLFTLGGSLLFGSAWSLDTGLSGGLSDQCVFISTEGQIAVYQGTNPSDAAAWSQVGVYQVGKPMGHKAHIRAGGDMVIATTIGFVPLSQAIQRDVAAIAPGAVSYPIEVAWNEAVQQRGQTGWACVVWPEGQMVVVSPPTPANADPIVFAANARTGAWAPFTNWQANCLTVFKGRLFFGSSDGAVKEAYVGGLDESMPYTGRYLPLFEDMRSPASLKIAGLARVVTRSSVPLNETVSCNFDFNTQFLPPPTAAIVPSGNEWDSGIWNESTWDSTRTAFLSQRWHSAGGTGYVMATAVQITSGNNVPIDAEIVRTDLTFAVSEIVT